MKPSTKILSAGLLVASLATLAPALAQPGGGPGWGMGPGMHGWGRGMMGEWGMGPRGMMGEGCPMMAFGDDGETATFIDGRIAFLKAELKITDAQKDVWQGYETALKANMDSMKAMHQLMQTRFEAKSPVERLDTQISAMTTRLDALKEMQPALSKLYDALDAKQKEAAEEVLTVMGCM